MNNTPIVVETTINAPVSKVWQALTDKTKMKVWYFDLPDFKPEPGFKFQFYGGTEEKSYLHLCQVTEVIPERKLAHTWTYENVPNETLVTFELFPESENSENKTRVKLTHTGVEYFPSDNPDFAKANFVAGWNHIIGTSLKEFAENN